MECRAGCGACCIAISISSAIPGMEQGKPAGIPCIHLTMDKKCRLFKKDNRPEVCINLIPREDMCGSSFNDAMMYLSRLEKETTP